MNEFSFSLMNQIVSCVVSSSNLDLVGGTGAIWVRVNRTKSLYYRSIPAVALYIGILQMM